MMYVDKRIKLLANLRDYEKKLKIYMEQQRQ